MERCILPCSFQVDTGVIIHWIQMKGLHVHSFYSNQDQLGNQHQIYRNRTSLFKDQISRGNASLQLTGVKVQDEGRYECFISTINRNKTSYINLKVDGMKGDSSFPHCCFTLASFNQMVNDSNAHNSAIIQL
uniref:Ig-like domain-containing protein n=1 Tax=Acanthochromis polyacanthus TaxID=80966 RepID=A0A3Q1GX02_9TELE